MERVIFRILYGVPCDIQSSYISRIKKEPIAGTSTQGAIPVSGGHIWSFYIICFFNCRYKTILFLWFQEMPEPNEIKAYTEFIAAICRMSKEQKRISATERPTNNEKSILVMEKRVIIQVSERVFFCVPYS